MSNRLDAALAKIDQNREAALERLFGLLRIKSISTDPAFKQDCHKAASWLVEELAGLGFEASLRATTGHPMVVAHYKKPGAPRVLFYGHYDVQPVDPLSLWDNPPFEPRLGDGPDGRKWIIGRGACDDKGQLMTFVEAFRGYIEAHGELPLDVTVFIEGEEESGSPSLDGFLKTSGEELKADLALVCDTGMWDKDTPAITATLRGMVSMEVTITCASRDLHSGLYGGAAQNPIRALAKILAQVHDDNGRVMIPGFYDGVSEPPREVKDSWQRLPFDTEEFLGEVGLSTPAGETGRSALELLWSRPTCEFNGISGGYEGDGFKTVIASKASAKVSYRLVGEQDPIKLRDAFEQFVRDRLPPDCTASFIHYGASPALRLSFDSPELQKAKAALEAEWNTSCYVIGGGGSIPVVGSFKHVLGMDSLLVGFGLDDDRVHSPNEKYELSSFQKGARSWARIIDAIAT